MTGIDALGSSTATTAQAKAREQLGQKDFLNLMLTQFRNQDPFKPMDGTQFLGQLAQFSTVSGIEEMNASLSGLTTSLRSDQMLAGAALVGRDVLSAGSSAALGAEGGVRGAVVPPAGAQQVIVSVRDAAGQLVHRFSVEPRDGVTDFAWDGTAANGARAPAGTYALQATAVTGTRQESLQVLLSDRVTSVTLDPRTHSLILNTAQQGAVPLADVQRIG